MVEPMLAQINLSENATVSSQPTVPKEDKK